MLSDLLLRFREGAVTLNHRWNTQSARRSLVLLVLIVALLALIVLASYLVPMGNAG